MRVTSPSGRSVSRPSATSSSVTVITGSRFDFWFEPTTRALRLRGYASGVVFDFSTSTPSSRLWMELKTGHAFEGEGGVAAGVAVSDMERSSNRDRGDKRDYAFLLAAASPVASP